MNILSFLVHYSINYCSNTKTHGIAHESHRYKFLIIHTLSLDLIPMSCEIYITIFILIPLHLRITNSHSLISVSVITYIIFRFRSFKKICIYSCHSIYIIIIASRKQYICCMYAHEMPFEC